MDTPLRQGEPLPRLWRMSTVCGASVSSWRGPCVGRRGVLQRGTRDRHRGRSVRSPRRGEQASLPLSRAAARAAGPLCPGPQGTSTLGGCPGPGLQPAETWPHSLHLLRHELVGHGWPGPPCRRHRGRLPRHYPSPHAALRSRTPPPRPVEPPSAFSFPILHSRMSIQAPQKPCGKKAK